jgi:hypothetical protein
MSDVEVRQMAILLGNKSEQYVAERKINRMLVDVLRKAKAFVEDRGASEHDANLLITINDALNLAGTQ